MMLITVLAPLLEKFPALRLIFLLLTTYVNWTLALSLPLSGLSLLFYLCH
jgi:hypothetical protein